jgi:hypothetical protein
MTPYLKNKLKAKWVDGVAQVVPKINPLVGFFSGGRRGQYWGLNSEPHTC